MESKQDSLGLNPFCFLVGFWNPGSSWNPIIPIVCNRFIMCVYPEKTGFPNTLYVRRGHFSKWVIIAQIYQPYRLMLVDLPSIKVIICIVSIPFWSLSYICCLIWQSYFFSVMVRLTTNRWHITFVKIVDLVHWFSRLQPSLTARVHCICWSACLTGRLSQRLGRFWRWRKVQVLGYVWILFISTSNILSASWRWHLV